MNISFDFNKYKFPEDWTKVKLKECLILTERAIKMEDDIEYKLVTVKRKFGGIQERSVQKGKEILVKSQFVINEGDFIISKRQIAHGACGIVPKELDNSIVSNEYNVFKTKKNLDLDFFNYYVQLPFVKRYFYISSDGVHIEKLLFKTNDWLNRYIVIPSLSEQEKIVKILSTWDLAIEKQQLLIEKKLEFKKGLIQKILSNENRVKIGEDKWEKIKVNDLGKIIRGVSYKPDDLMEHESIENVTLLRSNNILNNKIIYDDIRLVNTLKVKEEQKLKFNDIVICMANGSKKLVGKNGIFKDAQNKRVFTVGAFCSIFRCNNTVDSEFVKYLFESNRYYLFVQNLLAGSNINNLKGSDLGNMEFYIPKSIELQKKLISILKLTDKEIELLEKDLEALKLQKKGLMQRLLTGEVRVNIE